MRRIKNMCYCVGMCIILGLCGGCKEKETPVLTEISEEDTKEETAKEKDAGKEEDSGKMQVVYVCGEVKNPGVYEFSSGSRIYQAIEAAGGMTEKADRTSINQAELLEDGEQIYVPSGEEALRQPENDNAAAETNGKINLNTATKEELQTLPGIGEAKALSILAYREANGRFKSPEEIMKIEGIKNGVFNKIKDKIVVR